jgi:hypothetical protein
MTLLLHVQLPHHTTRGSLSQLCSEVASSSYCRDAKCQTRKKRALLVTVLTITSSAVTTIKKQCVDRTGPYARNWRLLMACIAYGFECKNAME